MTKKRGESAVILYIILGVVILLFAVAGVVLMGYFSSNSEDANKYTQTYSSNNPASSQKEIIYGVATEKDYDNFETVLSNLEMVKDLPDNGKILVSFYTWNDSGRIWERSYLLTKDGAKEIEISDHDIRLIIHSKYLTVLNSENFCQVINTAKNNGDFGSQTTMSKISLGWRYKGMMEYKDCLGI